MRRTIPEMVEPDSAETFASLEEAREAIDDCRRCPLYKMAT